MTTPRNIPNKSVEAYSKESSYFINNPCTPTKRKMELKYSNMNALNESVNNYRSDNES